MSIVYDLLLIIAATLGLIIAARYIIDYYYRAKNRALAALMLDEEGERF